MSASTVSPKPIHTIDWAVPSTENPQLVLPILNEMSSGCSMWLPPLLVEADGRVRAGRLGDARHGWRYAGISGSWARRRLLIATPAATATATTPATERPSGMKLDCQIHVPLVASTERPA